MAASVCDDGSFNVLSFASVRLRGMFAKYGDVIQADSTYQCNGGGYHLWHAVIADCNGVGRSVFYSFIRNESQECYDIAVEHFVRMKFPVNIVRTIVVDKNKSQRCSVKTVTLIFFVLSM
ncbi:hypothetical protein CLF_107199 [Clonorchis sinensis]|uniref:ZSWIM1/3 RNaseH-like domain-containing protein n=1 Tax=Clonorchis sinensis TaxID=79923 RepID=G7YGB7_CLOSI|nr:hypothetical protein CLF_107199 [Clonorchis sinensis]